MDIRHDSAVPPDTMAFCWSEERGYFVVIPKKWEAPAAKDRQEMMPDAFGVMFGCLLQSGNPEWIREQVQRFLDESD